MLPPYILSKYNRMYPQDKDPLQPKLSTTGLWAFRGSGRGKRGRQREREREREREKESEGIEG